MTPADVLEAAADALFVHGRATGSGLQPDGSMCVLGAILYAQDQDPMAMFWSYRDLAREALERWLHSALGLAESFSGSGRKSAWSWNDDQRGPEGDAVVIDTLRRCSKALREVES